MTDPIRKQVVILGSGGHARSIQECLESLGIRAAGFVGSPQNSALHDVSWLGDDDALSALARDEIVLVNGVGSIAATPARQRVFETAKAQGFTFLTLVDGSALVRPSATLGEGSIVLAGAIIGSDVTIGANVIINSGAIVEHGCDIGSHVHLAPASAIGGGTSVGERSHIGLGSRVLQGISIGVDCTIGAGAVVTRNIEDGLVAVGVPAVSRPPR